MKNIRARRGGLPDTRYVNMFIKMVIKEGNRSWEVYDGAKQVAEATSQTEAEERWLEYKYENKRTMT